MTSHDQRVVVFICTGNGAHSRLKLATWTLRHGVAVPVQDRNVSMTDMLRRTSQLTRALDTLPRLDLTCRKCPAHATVQPDDPYSRHPTYSRGVRNAKASQERTSTIVQALLDAPAFADRARVVYDVSQDPAKLF